MPKRSKKSLKLDSNPQEKSSNPQEKSSNPQSKSSNPQEKPSKLSLNSTPISKTISSDDNSSDISEVPSDLEEYLRSQTSIYQENPPFPISHQSSENNCFICSLPLKNKYELESHMHFHQPCNLFKCIMCGKSFKFKSSLNKHLRDYHSEEKLRRYSRRKTSKWLKSFLKSSLSEEYLFYAEQEKPNMVFFEDLSNFSTFHEELQRAWASREFYDDNVLKYEEFFEELK